MKNEPTSPDPVQRVVGPASEITMSNNLHPPAPVNHNAVVFAYDEATGVIEIEGRKTPVAMTKYKNGIGVTVHVMDGSDEVPLHGFGSDLESAIRDLHWSYRKLVAFRGTDDGNGHSHPNTTNDQPSALSPNSQTGA